MEIKNKVFLVAVLVIGIILFISSYAGFTPFEITYTDSINVDFSSDPFFKYSVKTYPVKVEAVDLADATVNSSVRIGVAGQTDELNFGRLPPGTSTRKIIEINNNEKNKAKAKIEISGNMEAFTRAEKNDEMILLPGKNEIKIECGPERKGNYSGEIKITVIYPKSSFFENLLYLM